MVTYNQLIKGVKSYNPRSAWEKGVKDYALSLLLDYDWDYKNIKMSDKIPDLRILEKRLLNGARDWKQYSWGGSSLIYDQDIAKALCTPSEYKKVMNGKNYGRVRKPNKDEDWLDVQARALYQAFGLIKNTYLALKG